MKLFPLDMLGQGNKKNAGGEAARKCRFEVLGRLARLGSGLSAAQQADWHWFKHSWDEKMAGEHKENWGGIFASLVQEVLDKLTAGEGNAFSLFVHSETKRCFEGVLVLACPG